MRTIAIINQKGGVGKTTTAVNLSAALAEAGQRVWLVDLDPQAHASLHLGLAIVDDSPSMYDVMTGQADLIDVCEPISENLWLSPSHIDLAAAELELAGEVGREIILRDAMAAAAIGVEYDIDYVVLDCPPSLGVLTLNALTASTEVFLPLQPHFLALHGLSKLLKTIELVARRLNSGLVLSNVLYCIYDSGTRLAGEVINDVEQFLADERSTDSVWANAESFRYADPSQYSTCRSPQLRSVDFSIRTEFQRRPGLPVAGDGSHAAIAHPPGFGRLANRCFEFGAQ